MPGIEITSLEGAHLLAGFPQTFSSIQQTQFLGFLEIPGSGDTKIASRRSVSEIFAKIEEEGGIVIVPHPFTQGIGLLDSARKISTKKEWLESGHVRLIQTSPEKIKFLDRDKDGNWINRFVLVSTSPAEIQNSKYSLAPFNVSDVDKSSKIDVGCSWFRMEHPGIEGLRQVACEPQTRILRTPPVSNKHDAIIGMHVRGGYCDGQIFHFNEGFNCIIGQNYAGKSSVLDFIRFALCQDELLPQDSRKKLYTRLNGILGEYGEVEIFLRQNGEYYVMKREFIPQFENEENQGSIIGCANIPTKYRFNQTLGNLEPSEELSFSIEAYEQGRISRLRDDINRQLAMIDGFAGLGNLKHERNLIVKQLIRSATELCPLYEEKEALKSTIENLKVLKDELVSKEKLLPSDDEKKWVCEKSILENIEIVAAEITEATRKIPLDEKILYEKTTDLEFIFCQAVPDFEPDTVIDSDSLTKCTMFLQTALEELKKTKNHILAISRNLNRNLESTTRIIRAKHADHQKIVSEKLTKAGIESPSELINRVNYLRTQIKTIESVKKPRLGELTKLLDEKCQARNDLLLQLHQLNTNITEKRKKKAEELTGSLGGQIKISILPGADKTKYMKVLDELCGDIATKDTRLQNREGQIERIVSTTTPVELAAALKNKGISKDDNNEAISLVKLCGITENTQNILCRIADNVNLLNKLETLIVDDIPQIQVLRRGETEYADLSSGLSPGEQSAAILTLALQTGFFPLIIDQPEDELGYSFVVHLIVPKILETKFSRQILIVTHNANIPVLSDADYLIKMENKPCSSGGRMCVISDQGSFESLMITKALIELEGGKAAFQFRQYRYSLIQLGKSAGNAFSSHNLKKEVNKEMPIASNETLAFNEVLKSNLKS